MMNHQFQFHPLLAFPFSYSEVVQLGDSIAVRARNCNQVVVATFLSDLSYEAVPNTLRFVDQPGGGSANDRQPGSSLTVRVAGNIKLVGPSTRFVYDTVIEANAIIDGRAGRTCRSVNPSNIAKIGMTAGGEKVILIIRTRTTRFRTCSSYCTGEGVK